MDELGADEASFLLIALVVGLLLAIGYYRRVIRVRSGMATLGIRLGLSLIPPLCLGFLLVILLNWSDATAVRDHPIYILLFMAGGWLWIGAVAAGMPWMGLSVGADAIERGNSAAAIAIGGMLLGVGAVYALSNVGAGPTIWTTLVPALVGSVALGLLYIVAHAIGGGVEAITIDRDRATGIRFAAFLIAAGILLGRAMAGDWHSWDETFRDFLVEGWPAAAIAVIAGIVDRLLRPSPRNPEPSATACGVLPAAAYFVVTILILMAMGPWRVNGGKP
jgi:uncharacterized membrane protein YjfL (UPF0719 family)